MNKNEKGAISTLVAIMVICFSSILIGGYFTVTTLQKSQQKSNLKIQQMYSEEVNKIDEIYAELQEAKAISINYEPNGGEDTSNYLQSVLTVDNIEEKDVNIYYSWNKSDEEEPTAWEECDNKQTVSTYNLDPGKYYLWGKVDDVETKETLKTEVSEEFTVKKIGGIVEEDNIIYNWQAKYEWGEGTLENPKYYQITLNITNNRNIMQEWEVKFDVQPGIIIEKCNVWCASYVETDGTTLTMKCPNWNNQIEEGATVNLEFILAFDNNNKLEITNFKIN